MTREQARDLLPILQAFADGEPIQLFCGNNKWCDVVGNLDVGSVLQRYRVKPKEQYRPFTSCKECWEEMQKHAPFGWLYRKSDTYYAYIDAVTDDPCKREPYNRLELYINNTSYSFSETFDDFTFADGTPFGIKELKEE